MLIPPIHLLKPLVAEFSRNGFVLISEICTGLRTVALAMCPSEY